MKNEYDVLIKEIEEELILEAEKAEQLKIEEFKLEREQIFLEKFRKLIFKGAICEIDFFGKVKKELKFSDWEEARVWLLERYSIQREGEKKFSRERIKTFLRWDNDISKYW